MVQPEPGQIGRLLILLGVVFVTVGAAFLLLGRMGLFRLPGDLAFGGRNWRIFIPITTCILLSVVLTLLLWLVNILRR